MQRATGAAADASSSLMPDPSTMSSRTTSGHCVTVMHYLPAAQVFKTIARTKKRICTTCQRELA